MKKIVCELCEGTVFDKIDGRFVCKGCGTSYSIEEAKGMMQEVEGEEPIAGSPVVSMPQPNANQQQLDNILMLASSAYEADNKAEAENYCNQAIVIDAMCYKAWFLKGKSVGWQSSIGNLRIEEAAHSFCKAIDFAPEDEKEDLKNQASEELNNLGLALISLRKKRFINSPDKEELNGFSSDKKVVLDALLVLYSHGNFVPIPEGYLEQVATLMNEAGVGALNTVRQAWKQLVHPGEADWKTYIGWTNNIAEVFRQAINTSDNDDEADIVRYKNLIIAIEEPLDSCSWTQQWNSYYSTYRDVKQYSLSTNAKVARLDEVERCKAKIEELEKRVQEKKEADRKKEEADRKKAELEKQARIEAYWESHAEEKAALESEKKELVDKREKLNAELNEVNDIIRDAEREKNEPGPFETEKNKVEDQIRDLNNRRAKLGIFAGKEKKQITEEIASLEGRVDSLKGKIEEEKKEKAADVEKRLAPVKARTSELGSELAPITKRISEIDAELTKDPEA